MPIGLAELGAEKRLDGIPGHRGPDRPSAHTEDVEVIVLDALLRREMIVDERRTNARDLVGTHRRAHAATANRHAAFDLSRNDGLRKRHDEVGIVVGRIQRVRAEIHDLVAGVAQMRDESLHSFKPNPP